MKDTLSIQLCFTLLLTGCASVTTPTGGPKDLKPPVLVKSIPSANQTNFKGKTVELVFNESVKLNNPKEEFIISPSPGKTIEIKAKGTRVTITPADKWQDSTTYSIVLREGIQDMTESNSPPNLKIAFSTGPNIDSLNISGRVQDLLQGTPVDKITVALYSEDTFNIFSHSPSYFTKTDKNGKYKLENIKPGKYDIYAFDDKNKNLKVESRTERYGFLANKIDLQNPIDSVDIGLIMMDSRPLKITSIRNVGTITRLRFNKYITDYSIHEKAVTHAFGDNETEIIFWNPAISGDSLLLHLVATDSIQSSADSSFYIKKTDVKPIKEIFRWSLGAATVESETGKFKTVMKFSKPPLTINLDSLLIRLDTTSTIPIGKEDISINERRKEINVFKILDKQLFTGDKDPRLTLKAGAGFIYSIDNDTSKSLSTPIPILWPEDTGILLVQVNTQEKDYLIQLLGRDGKIISSVQNVTKHAFKLLPPAEYAIRIILDNNKNGKWDPGNIARREEPEKVIFYKTRDGKQSFPMRANWEYGPLILKF